MSKLLTISLKIILLLNIRKSGNQCCNFISTRWRNLFISLWLKVGSLSWNTWEQQRQSFGIRKRTKTSKNHTAMRTWANIRWRSSQRIFSGTSNVTSFSLCCCVTFLELGTTTPSWIPKLVSRFWARTTFAKNSSWGADSRTSKATSCTWSWTVSTSSSWPPKMSTSQKNLFL